MNVIRAIYNFLVGDPIILVGVCIALLLLILIHSISFLALLQPFSGLILIVAVLITLTLSLAREAYSKER